MTQISRPYIWGICMVSASIRQSRFASLVWLYAGPVPVVMILICLVMMAPLLAIAVTATGNTADLMPHLLQTVLARYVGNTLLLMAGTLAERQQTMELSCSKAMF